MTSSNNIILFIKCAVGVSVALTVAEVGAAMQVIGLRDTIMTDIKTQVEPTPAAVSLDSFCVISTEGGVRLTFTNSSGMDSTTRSWRAINPAGETLRYRQYVTVMGDALAIVASDPAAAPIVVTAARAAKSTAGCGAGNVSKGIMPLDFTPAKTIYRDKITLTVTPL